MNAMLSYAFMACFLLLPPLMLGRRLFRGRPSWRLILATLILVGWVSCFGAVAFHFEALGDEIEAHTNPPAELVEEWAGDGGPMTFALLFGWSIAAAYSAAWYVIFLVLWVIRRLTGGRRRSDHLQIEILNRNAVLTPGDRE